MSRARSGPPTGRRVAHDALDPRIERVTNEQGGGDWIRIGGRPLFDELDEPVECDLLAPTPLKLGEDRSLERLVSLEYR